MLRHTSPRPWRAMKLIASGVTNSAARVKSPSFSRSSSSTRMTIFPARISSRASSILESGIRSSRFLRIAVLFQKVPGDSAAPLEVAQDVLPHDVGFQVDTFPGARCAERRPFQRERDEGHFEPIRAGSADREAHPVHG